MNYVNDEKLRKMAERHVDWYLSAMRPQLIDHFIHGFKHGEENEKK